MVTSTHGYPVAPKSTGSSRITGVLRRAPLIMMTVVFTLIGFRYLSNTVGAAAAAGISFTSPAGITIARIGFGALPLALAILAFSSLISTRWRLAGLYMVLTLDSLIIVVRGLSMISVHSTASARLFAPEALLLVLSLVAIHLELAARHKTTAQPGGDL